MSKQDGVAVRSAADLERKYQFNKRFAEITGIALDAQKSVDELGSSLNEKIIEQSSSFTRTTEEIRLQVSKVTEETQKVEERINTRIEGINGLFFYIRYSANADGSEMTEEPNENTQYMGTCSTSEETAPTDYSAYTWCKVVGKDGADGKDGVAGADGEDGKTQYLHIKYSDDGETFTENDGETLGAWIGTLVDFTEEDSTVFSDYTWKKFTEDVDEELEDIRRVMIEQDAEILQSAQGIYMKAVESYVEIGDFEEYKKTQAAELKFLSDSIYGQVSATNESIKGVNDDLQNKFNALLKYFSFTINGLEIGATYIDENGEEKASPNKVIVDNDEITIMVGTNEVIRFDADGNALIPTLKVEESINVVGLSVVEDDTHINCSYIRG